MIGNQIEFYLRGTSQPQTGAALVLILSAFLLVLMAYYLYTTAPGAARVERGARTWPARWSGGAHVAVHLWSLVPVLIAVRISFNAGRSRSMFQGFSFRWYWEDPSVGVARRRPADGAAQHACMLAALYDADRRALGAALAIGLARWRGRVATREQPHAAPARHARDRARRGPVPRVHRALHGRARAASPRSCSATSRSRSRSSSSSSAAGCCPSAASTRRRRATSAPPPSRRSDWCCCRCSGRRSSPASIVVFATSIDDFVISSFLSTDASNETVPMKIYSSAPRRLDAGAQRPGHHHPCHHPGAHGLGVRRTAAVAGPRRRRTGDPGRRRRPHRSTPERPPGPDHDRWAGSRSLWRAEPAQRFDDPGGDPR